MTACKSEGELRAFLDAELPDEMMTAVRPHLESCVTCRRTAARLESDSAWASRQMAVMVHSEPEAAHSTARALARLADRIQAKPSWKERMAEMFGLDNPRWRPALIALALVVVAVSFTLEPVRVVAGDFLAIFRVQEFAVIPVGPEQMERMEEIGRLLEQNYFLSEPIMMEEPEVETIATLDEASSAAGFAARTPGYLPEGFAPVEGIEVTGPGSAQLTVDLELARSLFVMAGLDPALLPDSLGEQPLAVSLSPMVKQAWRDQYRAALIFLQGPSPVVSFPDEVDPAALGAAALQLLGMSELEAERMSKAIDWTTTLVLPIPTDIVSFREVTIDGTRGLVLSEAHDRRGSHSALMWQKDGIVYFLQGNLQASDLMDVADSIH